MFSCMKSSAYAEMYTSFQDREICHIAFGVNVLRGVNFCIGFCRKTEKQLLKYEVMKSAIMLSKADRAEISFGYN